MSTPASTVAAFFAALERGDFDYCSTLFTDDAVIWHNYEQREQSSAAALSELAALAPTTLRFEIVGRDLADDVCFQRHVVHLSGAGGASAQFPAIQRIELQDSLIRRIDEYLDPAAMIAAGRAAADQPAVQVS